MRISWIVSALACSIPAFLAPSLSAQITSIGSVAGGYFVADGNEGGSKQPYTATITSKSVQVLPNGVTITHENTTRTARDGSGRVYSEHHNSFPGPDGQQQREIITYFVMDPVAHTTLQWNSNGKQATLFHQPEPQTLKAQPAPPAQRAQTSQAPKAAHSRPDIQHEDLGTREIAGVNAIGTRTTETIPAGRIGNDQPFNVVTESWRSADYGMVMFSTSDDPRFGKTTREVTDFQPGEPDAALFRAPEGYTVKDVSPKGETITAQ